MSRRLTTTIGHRVDRVKTTRTKYRQGHFVTLAIVAAVGIAAGSILILGIDRNMSGKTETSAVEKRHVVSSVVGKIAAFPHPGKQVSMTGAEFGSKQDISVELALEPRRVAISVVPVTTKNPRLADTAIVTSSTETLQSRGTSLAQPAPERFGGALPSAGAGKLQALVEAASVKKAKSATVRSASSFSDQRSADVPETETAALEIKHQPEVLDSQHSNLAADPVTPAAEAEVRLRKGRVKKFANLRSGPDNNAPVLAVIPANAQVLAQINCVHWCRAAYKGQKGYIYRALIRQPGKSSKAARASARKTAKGKQASVSKPVETVSQKRVGEIGR